MMGWWQSGLRACALFVAIAGLPACGGRSTQNASPAGCVAEVAAGGFVGCARRTDGTLWCWGIDSAGEIAGGDMLYTGVPTPTQIEALGSGVVSMAVGEWNVCAVKTDGSLWCWGANYNGQLGNGSVSDQPTADPLRVDLGGSVAQVAVGQNFVCARKTDGSVWCWGENDGGELGDGTYSDRATPARVDALGTTVVSISAGVFHTCALQADGSVWCWGANDTGESGPPGSTCTNGVCRVAAIGAEAVEVVAGAQHTCVRKQDGTLWCWGWNTFGQVGDGTTTDAFDPRQVTALGADVVEVTAYVHFTCARKRDASVWCWGADYSGQVDVDPPNSLNCDGTTMCRTVPLRVPALPAATQIAAADDFACALVDGTVWCWGGNSGGELGRGTAEPEACQKVDGGTYCAPAAEPPAPALVPCGGG